MELDTATALHFYDGRNASTDEDSHGGSQLKDLEALLFHFFSFCFVFFFLYFFVIFTKELAKILLARKVSTNKFVRPSDMTVVG